MPRAVVEAAARDVVLHGPLARGISTELLVNTLATMVRTLPELPVTDAPFYARVLRDLLAAATAGCRIGAGRIMPRGAQLSSPMSKRRCRAHYRLPLY